MRDGDQLGVELMARREDWAEGISIYLRRRTVGQGCEVAAPIQLVRLEPGVRPYVEPMLRLEITEAQQLMDELWHCGLRPTEGTGSAGALAATQKHLDDMRAISRALLVQRGIEPTPEKPNA